MGGAERVKPIRLYRKGRKIYQQPGVSLGGDRFLRRFGVGADRGRCVGFYEPLGESCTFRQDRESPGYRIPAGLAPTASGGKWGILIALVNGSLIHSSKTL